LQHLKTFSVHDFSSSPDSPVETLSFLWETIAWSSLKKPVNSANLPIQAKLANPR
jgi:hypothetical protein